MLAGLPGSSSGANSALHLGSISSSPPAPRAWPFVQRHRRPLLWGALLVALLLAQSLLVALTLHYRAARAQQVHVGAFRTDEEDRAAGPDAAVDF